MIIDITLDPTFAVQISLNLYIKRSSYVERTYSHWILPLQRTEVYTGKLKGAPMLNDLIPHWIQPLQRTEAYTGTLY